MKHDPTLNTLAKGTIVFHKTRGKGVVVTGPWGVWFVCSVCGSDISFPSCAFCGSTTHLDSNRKTYRCTNKKCKAISPPPYCKEHGGVALRQVTGGKDIYEMRFDSNPSEIECINTCGLVDEQGRKLTEKLPRVYIKIKHPIGRPRKEPRQRQLSQQAQRLLDQSRWQEALELAKHV